MNNIGVKPIAYATLYERGWFDRTRRRFLCWLRGHYVPGGYYLRCGKG